MILYTLVVLPLSGPQSYANVLIQSQIFCSSLCVAGVFRAGQLNWCRDENERNLSLSLCSFGCSAGFPHQDAQAPAEWAPTASLVSLCFLCEMDDMKPKVKEGTRKVRTGHAFPWLTGFRTHTHIYIYFALGPIDLPRYTFTLWVRQVIEPAQPSLPGWPLRPQGESLCRASDGWGLETTGGQSTLQRCARRRCNLGWSWILVRWTKDKILIWMKGYEAGFGSTCDTWGCKHCWQKADKGRKQQGWRMVLSGKYEWIWTRQTSIWILLGWWPEKPWCHSHHWTPKKSAVVLGQDSGQFLSKSFSSSTESRVLHGVPYQSNIAYSWISCLKM